MMNTMNTEINNAEMNMIAGGTGPLNTCDPPFQTGPLTTGPLNKAVGPVVETGPLTTGPLF